MHEDEIIASQAVVGQRHLGLSQIIMLFILPNTGILYSAILESLQTLLFSPVC